MTAVTTRVPSKNFDADAAASLPPSCTFTLGGREWACKAKEDVALNVLTDLYTHAQTEDTGGLVMGIGPFFEAVIVEEQLAEFRRDVLHNPVSKLTLGVFPAVMEYVVSNILGRPTKPADDSAPGTTRTARKSTAGSSSRGTRHTA